MKQCRDKAVRSHLVKVIRLAKASQKVGSDISKLTPVAIALVEQIEKRPEVLNQAGNDTAIGLLEKQVFLYLRNKLQEASYKG